MRIQAVLFATCVLSAAPAAFGKGNCRYSEGDDFTVKGKYLLTATCTVHGNVEAVNKDCTKVKLTVAKVTGAFGVRIHEKCHIRGGGDGAAGGTLWVSLQQK